MDYEIKQVASLIGISDNGVRFLEKKGLARPDRDEGSGYRRYHEDDLAMLALYRSYKADGLELSDIQEAFQEPAGKVSERLAANLDALKARVSTIERNVRASLELLGRVSESPSCGFEDRPRFAFLDADSALFKRNHRHGDNADMEAFYRQWYGLMPQLANAIRYEIEDDGSCRRYVRGGLIGRDDLAGSGLEASPYLTDYPAQAHCFHVSLSYPNAVGDEEELAALLKLLSDHVPGALACGTIIGRLLHMQDADEGIIYSAEYWIPYRQG